MPLCSGTNHLWRDASTIRNAPVDFRRLATSSIVRRHGSSRPVTDKPACGTARSGRMRWGASDVSHDRGSPQPSCPCCQVIPRPWSGASSGWVECDRCGLVFRYPMPSQEELDEAHGRVYAAGGSALRAVDMVSTSAALVGLAGLATRLAPPGARVLDFGAGVGELASLLRARGFDVVGLERCPSARAAAAASGFRFHPDLIRVERGAFDLVIAIEVVEHLRRPLPVLRALHDRLAPGGLLLLTTPNRKGLHARLRKGQWREARDPCHVVLFDRRSLGGLLREAGFTSNSPRSLLADDDRATWPHPVASHPAGSRPVWRAQGHGRKAGAAIGRRR